MPYSIRQSATSVDLIQSGAVVLSLDPEINPKLCGHLCTPAFHDGGTVQQRADGAVIYVNALSDANGKWIIDLVAKRFRCASASLDETVKAEDQRDEVLALRSELAQELTDGLGITLARARFFVGWLWRFLRIALRLLGH